MNKIIRNYSLFRACRNSVAKSIFKAINAQLGNRVPISPKYWSRTQYVYDWGNGWPSNPLPKGD